MNYRRILHGAKFWFWVALFVAYSAGAVGLVILRTRPMPEGALADPGA